MQKNSFIFWVLSCVIMSAGLWLYIQRVSDISKGYSVIDHASISVSNYEKSLLFYDQTFAILGYTRNMTIDIPEKNVKVAGYGKEDKPSFWISPMGKKDEDIAKARGVHFAFLAPSTDAVDAWHKKCLELGGRDNGSPGLRPHYHPGYYGAFIIDPDGWRIEAVFHEFKK